MDIKYAYYNTSKGYRVVGGTAAHFLKADGSLDNTEYIDKYSIQTIDSTKTIGFQNTIYSGWDRSSVTNPQMGPFSLLNLALQGAYPLYGDEEFRYGNNGIGVYNNYGNGTVTMTREAASNLPNRSGMQLRFNYNGGGATPGLGGFLLGFNARANAIFIQKFMAKLPVGYSFNNAENYMGANASVNWLTPRAGTGKWETYVRAVICGTGTSFSSGGHVYVLGADTAVEFYLAFAEVYEVNSSVFSKIREAFYAKNETIHFNGATADLITVGDSYNQKKLLSTSWDGTNGDQILLRVPGSQNNGAYLRYSQNGTLNGNIGLVSSDNLTGGQIFNPQGDTLYLGNPSLPNLLLQTSTNTHFNYAGVGSIYTFNVNGVYLDRNINFNLDNSGVNFYDGGKIYKKAGSGVHINRGNNGLDPRIENADGSQSWMIFHEGNHNPFKNLRSGFVLEDVSESGIYRQESPTSGYNYTTTLNLNSSDGRQQLTIERGGKGMKFRGNTKNTGNSGWSGWNEVYHTGNFNSAIYVTQSALNTQLGNYATLNGVQTFTNTNTFNQSPIIPQGTLDSHAVNLAQLTNGNVATAGSLRNVNISLAQLNSMDLQPGMYNAEGYSIGQGLTATYHYIIQLGSYTGGGYRAQIAIPYSNGVNDSIYIRTSVGSTWGNFERIAKNTDITTALSNYALANGSNATDTWANAAKMLVTNPYIPGRTMNSSGSAYLNEATYGDVHGFLNSNGTAQGNPTDNWFHRIKMLHSNSSGYFTEIGVQMTGGNSMWYKRYENGTDYGWVQVWDKQSLTPAHTALWDLAYNHNLNDVLNYNVNDGDVTRYIKQDGSSFDRTRRGISVIDARVTGNGLGSSGSPAYIPNPQLAALNNKVLPLFHTTSQYGGGYATSLITKGWTDNYKAWRITGPGDNNNIEQDFFLSQSRSDTGAWFSDRKIWTDRHFTQANINSWNSMTNSSIQLNVEFTTNLGTGLMLSDDRIGGESGLIDIHQKAFIAGKIGEYYKYGSSIDGLEGINYDLGKKNIGIGGDIDSNKVRVEGCVKAIGNFKSEEENPDTMFIPDGQIATLRDEIVNEKYAIRLNPHEYGIDAYSTLDVDDRNRLIHIVADQVDMRVNFNKIYPKQQIVIYNFDQKGNGLEVQINGKTIYYIEQRCFLRLYVTDSLRVIAERQQPCDFVW